MFLEPKTASAVKALSCSRTKVLSCADGRRRNHSGLWLRFRFRSVVGFASFSVCRFREKKRVGKTVVHLCMYGDAQGTLRPLL